jgi:phosphatidylglycerophosphate synthase
MSKLNAQDKFLDLSDYARPPAIFFANKLKNTRFTPIHVTLLFGISGLLAVFCILKGSYNLASFFIILKSCIDAADGELARLNQKPSYIGRYLDSVFDIVLNFLFLMAICYVSKTTFFITLIAFLCLQLQGTLYNYYYVILRNKSVDGDSTSKIFEYKTPKALLGESQKSVNVLYVIYVLFYGLFDRVIHLLDKEAYKCEKFPNWFMTIVSIYGLGFQLLIMAVMLVVNLINFIPVFFIFYTLFIFLLIGLRKLLF